MSRVVGLPRGIAWDPVAGADDYNVHVDRVANGNFLAEVDDGSNAPYATVPDPEFMFADYPEEDFNGASFAVVAHATQGGIEVYSDPYQPAEFTSVPLAFAPVPMPANGRLVV